MERRDYAFPFRIGPAGQAVRSDYASHVAQMVEQVLLTAPGERADLPEFGCGLRRLIFAPRSEALEASTKMIVQASLARWLGSVIEVKEVGVAPEEETPVEGELDVVVTYRLLETQTDASMTVRVLP